jgi:hypothetical protein
MEKSGRRRRQLALATAAALGIAVLAAGVWWLWLRGSGEPAPRRAGAIAGETIAAGAIGAIAAAEEIREPYHCARWDVAPEEDTAAAPEPEVLTAFGRRFERSGRALHVGGGDSQLVIGFVADARGADDRTLAHIATVRAAFDKRGVELVISLGGMGRDEKELTAVLDALSRNARWPVLAIPGGRESLPAHRAAVEAVANGGRGVVFDGAAVRLVEMDGASVGTLPGIAEPAQLLAGNDGCVHGVEQLVKFANELSERPAPRVVASYAPPRQGGETGSDLVTGGIHIGEPAVAQAVNAAKPSVVVHGLVDEAADDENASGKPRRAHTTPLVLGAGAIEGLPLWKPDGRVVGGSAVIVKVVADRVTWRRIGLPVAVD